MTELYTLLKLPIQLILSHNKDLQLSPKEEQPYCIDLTNSLLFDQIFRLRTAPTRESTSHFIDELIFVLAPKNPKTEQGLKEIISNGFTYNNKHYVRFGKSASQSKEGITVFVLEDIYDELFAASQMDIQVDKCVISKYESQRCLIFSSCTLIHDYIPNIVIVDEYTKVIPHQFIHYVKEEPKQLTDKKTGELKTYINRTVEEGYKDITLSPFDGCGCHSLEFAQRVGDALNLDYVPYGCQIRMPFVKGYSVYVPFKEILAEWGVTEITDIYGKAHNVQDIDAIWNITMFKAHKLFKAKYGNEAWNEYMEAFRNYQYKVGISKYAHHVDHLNLKARLNFQYIQTLNLWNPDYIEHGFDKGYDILRKDNASPVCALTQYTTQLFENIIKGDKFYTLKFLGVTDTDNSNPTSKYVEAALINDVMLKDPAIKRFIYNKLTKYIEEAKIGKVYAEGFYHTIIGDMLGYLEYIANKEVKGCLNAHEFYCGVHTYPHTYAQQNYPVKALSFRSPLICPSEVNEISIATNDIIKKWFSHFQDQDIAMVNMYDISLPQQGGAD